MGIFFLSVGCCSRRYPEKRIKNKKSQIIKKHKSKHIKNNLNSKHKRVIYQSDTSSMPEVIEFQTTTGKVKVSDYRLKPILKDLSNRKFSDATLKILKLKKDYPPSTPQREALDYLYADTIFSNNELGFAKVEYEKFLKQYPNSPLRENVEKALEFIRNIKKYKKMYVPPEKDGK